jgi:1-phosphofructokinase family hexose kinase
VARRRAELDTTRAPIRLVAVSLSPSIDVTYVVDALAVGEIHRTEQVYRVPGGKGFNVARAAHALSGDVVATGVLGGDAGAWMVQALARTGMRILPVAGTQPTRTCVAVADASTGTLTEFYEPAPRIEPRAWSNLVASVARLCEERPSWVSLSGSLPPGPVPEALVDLMRAAQDAGARVAVDTHSTALAAAVGAGPELIKVNVREAAALLGTGSGTGDRSDVAVGDALGLARALLDASGRTELSIVTAGPDGAVAAGRDGTVVRARLAAVGKFPVGSGDSFLGGLLTALSAEPDDLDGALRLAMAAGAANAMTPGAGVLDPDRVAELVPAVEIEHLRVGVAR